MLGLPYWCVIYVNLKKSVINKFLLVYICYHYNHLPASATGSRVGVGVATTDDSSG